MKFVIYNPDGEIARIYSGRKDMVEKQLFQGEDFYPRPQIIEEGEGEEKTTRTVYADLPEDISDETYKMDLSDPDNPAPVKKDALPVTIDKTTATVRQDITLSGIMAGTIINLRGGGKAERVQSDEDVVMSFDAPDTYTIQVNHPLHLPVTFEVTVNAG